MASKSEYTVSYSSMQGVDLTGTGGRKRYAYLENMYRDYDGVGGDLIESIPGYRALAKLSGRINAIHSQKDRSGARNLLIHAGDGLYRAELSEENEIIATSFKAKIKDGRSRAVQLGHGLIILDGEKIIRIKENGEAKTPLTDTTETYLPTTYLNGERHEQANLLREDFKESTFVADVRPYLFGTHALEYEITDPTLMLCRVTGIGEAFKIGVVNIPSYVKIGDTHFRVTEIAESAFKNHTGISEVRINEGVSYIGTEAFSGCTGLRVIYAPDTLEEIGERAFSGCTNLSALYLGSSFRRFGEDAFNSFEYFKNLYYNGTEEEFNLIENRELVSGVDLTPHFKITKIILDIPVYTEGATVSGVTVGDDAATYTVMSDTNGTSVLISADSPAKVTGKKITVYATRVASIDGISCKDALAACTLCESFDGRLFLSGNPNLPNTVFYSSRIGREGEPLYFGEFDYFNDGMGAYPVIAMLAAGDSLAVFKENDDGCGSIFYHVPKSTEDDITPKIYPVSYVHSGICATGDAISFFDDPVFMTRAGLSALDKRTISLERSVVTRSHNVNPLLLSENAADVRMARWCGYLALAVNGQIFLADSRATFRHQSGGTEYEWYYLNGIGGRESATRVYRYASVAHDGYELHARIDEPTDKTVMSVGDGEGGLIYYTNENGVRYEVSPTEEMTGGAFSPLSTVHSIDDELLLFGTEGGEVFIFNNDKRGVAPDALKAADDFDPEEYENRYGRSIDKSFYSFAQHAPKYTVKTVLDDCDIPHLTKSTVKHSLAVKCKISGGGTMTCEVGREGGGYTEAASVPNEAPDFSRFTFCALVFETDGHTTVPISEKEKGWVEKEITVSSEGVAAPIGIYSITYRYTVKGRIKIS